jgi:hypothetical protein
LFRVLAGAAQKQTRVNRDEVISVTVTSMTISTTLLLAVLTGAVYCTAFASELVRIEDFRRLNEAIEASTMKGQSHQHKTNKCTFCIEQM